MVRAQYLIKYQVFLSRGPWNCMWLTPMKLALMGTKERCGLVLWKFVIRGFDLIYEIFPEEVNLA